MDRSQWVIVSRAVDAEGRKLGRLPRARFTDALIVKLYLWSVAHDRPLCWACRRESYGGVFRPRASGCTSRGGGGLPSVSQFTRRIKTARCRGLLQRVHDRLAHAGTPVELAMLDGKPLPVGGASKDRDAKRGYAVGGFAKGYKLHALADERRRIVRWCVRPLNEHESAVAPGLLDGLPTHDRTLVLADGAYDTGVMHRRVAHAGARLRCPPRAASARRRQREKRPLRRVSLWVWTHRPGLARWVYRERLTIERVFAALCGVAGGLAPLPAWVRTLDRVTRWVGAKIILYHARLEAKPDAQAHAA